MTIIVNNDQWLANGLKYLVSVAVYCAIGWGVDYWLFIPDGGLTDWTIPSTYLVMLFWPFILLWGFIKWAFIAAVVIGVIVLIVAVVKRIAGR